MMLPEMRIYTTRNDIKYLLVEQDEIISNEVKKSGFWGKDYIDLCQRILNKSPSGRVIDVGAGFGTFTIPLSIVFSDKHVFEAIEPLPKVNMQLSANILLNFIDNVNVHKYVIGNENIIKEYNSLDFHRSGNHGSFSFNGKYDEVRGFFHDKKLDRYEYKKLDEFCFANVVLIKVTTPSMENDVFMGMYSTLEQNNWPPVLFESWRTDWYKEDRERALDFFAARGYEHYVHLGDHVVAFKTKSQAEYLLDDSSVPEKLISSQENNDFTFTVQHHETDSVLKHQVGATNL